MPGRVFDILLERAVEQYGYLTPGDAEELGVDPRRLVEMERRGTLARVARGVYRFDALPYTGREQYMEAVLWPNRARGVVSHETAVHLYGLSDINPDKVDVTVPVRYRINREVPSHLRIHHANLADDEVTALEGIPIVTAAKAIRQCHAAGVRRGLVQEAIGDGRRTGWLHRQEAEALEAEVRSTDAPARERA